MIVQNVSILTVKFWKSFKILSCLDLGEKFAERSVVALLNGESLWHMHRPIPDSCKLELLHYQVENPLLVNKTFWRSCSFLLGAVVKDAFKDNINLYLHSFPSPNGKFFLGLLFIIINF